MLQDYHIGIYITVFDGLALVKGKFHGEWFVVVTVILHETGLRLLVKTTTCVHDTVEWLDSFKFNLEANNYLIDLYLKVISYLLITSIELAPHFKLTLAKPCVEASILKESLKSFSQISVFSAK